MSAFNIPMLFFQLEQIYQCNMMLTMGTLSTGMLCAIFAVSSVNYPK